MTPTISPVYGLRVRRYFFRSKVTLNYPYHSEDLQHENRTRQNRSIQRDGVKPGFNEHQEKGQSAFETITEQSFSGQVENHLYLPEGLHVRVSDRNSRLRQTKDFEDRDAVLLAGSTDNEFCKLGWRRDHNKELSRLNHWQFADTTGVLVDQLGIREKTAGVALRATFIVDPDNVSQHVSVNNLNVGRNPDEVLRLLDGLQTDELCPCNRAVGGAAL